MSAGLEPKRSYLEMMGFAEEKAKVPKVTSGMKEPVVGSKVRQRGRHRQTTLPYPAFPFLPTPSPPHGFILPPHPS